MGIGRIVEFSSRICEVMVSITSLLCFFNFIASLLF